MSRRRRVVGVVVQPISGETVVLGTIPAEVKGAPPLPRGRGRVFTEGGRVLDLPAGQAMSVAAALEEAMTNPRRMAPPELDF
jgi:hypothetical protein